MSVAKLGTASLSRVIPFLGLLVVVLVSSGFGDIAERRSAVTGQVSRAVSVRADRNDVGHVHPRRSASTAPLRASAPVVSSNRSRSFVWPSRRTPTYQRAVRMARHGDPEARKFVGGESDINPFDVQ
jgi:hypothetical protein